MTLPDTSPIEAYIEPAGAIPRQEVKLTVASDTRRVEVFGVYQQCDTCRAPALSPFPPKWTFTFGPSTDDEVIRFAPPRYELPRPLEITPHRPTCPEGHLAGAPPTPPPAPPLPRRIPGATLDAPAGGVLIGPIGADPADLSAFVDVGHTTGDGLTCDPVPASDHNPAAPGTVAAVDVDAGDLVPAMLSRGHVDMPVRLAPFIGPEAVERIRLQFEAAREHLAARLRPALLAVAETFARLRPLIAAVTAYQARVDRGAKRAARRGTATTRAIARRNGRRVPQRGPRLHRIRTAYRHRQ